MHYVTIIHQKQVHVWEGEGAAVIKHLLREQLSLNHGSLFHSPKAVSLPANIAVTKEPKERQGNMVKLLGSENP